MIAFYIILFLVLLLISIKDYATSEIPNVLNIALGVLGLVYYFINIKTNWWLPLVLVFGSFVFFFVFFLITGELAIGGGDMKMVIVSMLFVNNLMSLMDYLYLFCLFIVLGVIITYAKGEGKYVRCGPYLGLSLLFMIIGPYLDFNQCFTIVATFLIATIGLSSSYLIWKGEMMYNEEIYSIY